MKRKLGYLAAILAASIWWPMSASALADTGPGAPASSTLTGAILSAQVAELENDFPAMIAYYKQSLGFDPGNQQFEQNLMLAYLANGQFKDALPYAEKLKAVPEIERVSRVALGIDAVSKQDWNGAEAYLKLAVQSDLDRLITGLMTGWVKFGAGDGKGAVEHVSKLQGPAWFGMFKDIHKALLLDATGDKDGARAAYQQAAASTDNSSAPDAWLRLMEAYANFLARDGDTKGALDAIGQGLEIAPERPPLLALKALIDSGGKPSGPLVAAPLDGVAEVLFDLGSAVRRDGSDDFARLYLQLSAAAKPGNDVNLLQLAAIAENSDRPEEAIALYEQVDAASPFRRGAELQAGLNLADTGKTDEAVKILEGLMADKPEDPRTYLGLGGVYAAKKDFKAAADVYNKAVSAIGEPHPEDWNLFYQRGIALERTKNWPEAEKSFRTALKLYPDHPQVLNYLGYSFVDRNENLDEALGMIRKAVELRSDDGYIVDSLGWAYYRLGRFPEAVTELEKAIDLRPEDATINDHLGDAYWRVGRKLEARFQWQHALDAKSEDVDNALIKAKLAATVPVIAEAISEKKG